MLHKGTHAQNGSWKREVKGDGERKKIKRERESGRERERERQTDRQTDREGRRGL